MLLCVIQVLTRLPSMVCIIAPSKWQLNKEHFEHYELQSRVCQTSLRESGKT
jgi:hypothetical protein